MWLHSPFKLQLAALVAGVRSSDSVSDLRRATCTLPLLSLSSTSTAMLGGGLTADSEFFNKRSNHLIYYAASYIHLQMVTHNALFF